VSCSVWQFVAACCRVGKGGVVCCSVVQCALQIVLQCVAVCCSVLQCVAVCSVLQYGQCGAVCYNACVAMRVLQHKVYQLI